MKKSKNLEPILIGIFASLIIGFLAFLSFETSTGFWLMFSFGSTTLIVLIFYDSEFSQPRNIFFGHLLGILVGIIFNIFFGISFIFIVKCILSFSTILPDSSGKCQVKLLTGGCNDLLCSGHFSIVFLIYLLVEKYKLVNKNMNCALLVVMLYGSIPIITKKHYTIDILVAIMIVLLVNNYIPNK